MLDTLPVARCGMRQGIHAGRSIADPEGVDAV